MSDADHPWLQRVSDYHSGGVAEAERMAVEAHLVTCAICQRALAEYRRFYSLARSPLRLGAPSQDAVRTPMRTSSVEPDFEPRARIPLTPRRRVFVGIATSVAAAVIVVGFLAVFAAHLRSIGPAATPTASAQPSVSVGETPSPSATGSVTPTATQAPFVCANPAGSSAVYAYTGEDGQLYWVKGCSVPQQLTHLVATSSDQFPSAQALAWSPSNRYLMFAGPGSNEPPFESPLEIADTQTGAITTTQYHLLSFTPTSTADREFIGWLDDATFLGAVTQNEPLGTVSPVEIVRVNAQTQAETHVTTLMYAAKLEVRGGALFYGGYASVSESKQGAHLHRVDLTTGADTMFVSLGAFGDGGCQVYGPCNWTTPWDVTPDGQHLVYHNPGAAHASSEVGNVADTPIYYANLDGSQAEGHFGVTRGRSLLTPVIAPDGLHILAMQSGGGSGLVATVGMGGSVTVNGDGWSWRSDSAALVITVQEVNTHYPDGIAAPVLDFIADNSTQAITLGTTNYVWGN